MNAPALNKDASLLSAYSVCQQQSAGSFGSDDDSNAEARLEGVFGKRGSPRRQLLQAITDLEDLQRGLASFDGEFRNSEDLVNQLIRIRGSLLGLMRAVPV